MARASFQWINDFLQIIKLQKKKISIRSDAH